MSGTTDAEFVETIPAGVDMYAIYFIPRMSPAEVRQMLTIPLCQPLRDLREFDPDLVDTILDSSGAIPRKIAKWCNWLNEFQVSSSDNVGTSTDPADQQNAGNAASRKRHFCEILQSDIASLDKPNRKRLRREIQDGIEQQNCDETVLHQNMILRVIKKDSKQGIDTYRECLWNWCTSFYLRNQSQGYMEILRVPNFVGSRTQMFPTTLGASRAYFRWFLTEGGGKSDADLGIATDLDTLSRGEGGIGDTGGERGNAFERYLAAKLTLTSNTILMTRSISEDPTVKHSRTILIKDRVYTTCHLPPLNFRSYTDGTVLTHTDQTGGEHRLDLVYYGGQNEVIFIEATVGNFRQLKIPTKDDGMDFVRRGKK